MKWWMFTLFRQVFIVFYRCPNLFRWSCQVYASFIEQIEGVSNRFFSRLRREPTVDVRSGSQIILLSFLICMICDDLWDFCAKRTPFLSRLRREIFQIYPNISNLFIFFDLYDLWRFVRFLREAHSISLVACSEPPLFLFQFELNRDGELDTHGLVLLVAPRRELGHRIDHTQRLFVHRRQLAVAHHLDIAPRTACKVVERKVVFIVESGLRWLMI